MTKLMSCRKLRWEEMEPRWDGRQILAIVLYAIQMPFTSHEPPHLSSQFSHESDRDKDINYPIVFSDPLKYYFPGKDSQKVFYSGSSRHINNQVQIIKMTVTDNLEKYQVIKPQVLCARACYYCINLDELPPPA